MVCYFLLIVAASALAWNRSKGRIREVSLLGVYYVDIMEE